MAYSTGTVTNLDNLADLFVTFATGNGWTQNGTTVTQGTGKKFHLTKSSLFFNFRTFNTETPSMAQGTTESFSQAGAMLVNPSTGYSGALDWYNQTGAATYSGSQATNQTQTVGLGLISGSIPAYHFFAFSDVLYIIVENPGSTFKFLMLGMLDKTKYGSETSPKGQFITGTACHSISGGESRTLQFFGSTAIPSWTNGVPNCILNCAVATGFNGFAYRKASSIAGTVTNSPRPQDSITSMQPALLNMPNSFSSTSPFFPIIVGCYETTGNYWVPIGELPQVYLTNITNFNPADTVTIGSDNYKIFPFHKKDITNPVSTFTTNGSTVAFAIKY